MNACSLDAAHEANVAFVIARGRVEEHGKFFRFCQGLARGVFSSRLELHLRFRCKKCAAHLVQKVRPAVLAKPRKNVDAPGKDRFGGSILSLLAENVHIPADDVAQIRGELCHCLRKIWRRLIRAVELGERIPDLAAEKSARVALFHELDSLIHFAQSQIRFRDLSADRLFVDFRIRILVEQQTGLLEQLQRAAKQFFVLALNAERAKDRGAFLHDLKRVRIPFQRFFRLRKSFPVLIAAVFPHALYDRVDAVILHGIAEQRIHGGIEEVRHLHDQGDIGHGKPRFPLIDGARRDHQHFCKLFLRQRPFLPQSADVFRKLHFHASRPPSRSYGIIIQDLTGNVNRPFILSEDYFIYCQYVLTHKKERSGWIAP